MATRRGASGMLKTVDDADMPDVAKMLADTLPNAAFGRKIAGSVLSGLPGKLEKNGGPRTGILPSKNLARR